MKTIFKLEDKVFHLQHGWGEVIIIDTEESYPITVCFNDSEMYRFTKEGRKNSWDKTPTLSFTEYTLQGFTQERPIVLPEVGELCLARNDDHENWLVCKFIEYSTISIHPFVVNMQMFTLDTNCFRQLKRIKILD
jgi:hypothetical protein